MVPRARYALYFRLLIFPRFLCRSMACLGERRDVWAFTYRPCISSNLNEVITRLLSVIVERYFRPPMLW